MARAIIDSINIDDFDIIPAISIQRGMIVQVRNNKYVPLSFRGSRPQTLDLIDVLYEAFEVILILDLDGIYRNKPAVDLYKSISNLGDFWIDGGVRYCDTIIDLLVTGAQYVVLGTKTLADLNEVKEAVEMTENIIFGLDYNRNIISPVEAIRARRPENVIKEVVGYGVDSCLVADLGRVGSEKPLDVDLIRSLSNAGINIFAGGGVKQNDLETLYKLGAVGAIIELSEVLDNPEVFSIDPMLFDELAPPIKDGHTGSSRGKVKK